MELNFGKNNYLNMSKLTCILSFLRRYPLFFQQYFSELYPINLEMIKKFHSKLDWEKIIYNKHVLALPGFIERFQNQIDWPTLSIISDFPWTEEFIERFKDRICWKNNGGTSMFWSNSGVCFTPELIDRYSDRMDWFDFSWNSGNFWSLELLERYEEQINWGVLSCNTQLPFTVELVERFYDRWTWHLLRANQGMYQHEKIVMTFIDKLNWEMISHYSPFIDDDFVNRWYHKIDFSGLSTNESYTSEPKRLTKLLERQISNNDFARLSQNTQINWTEEFIDRYIDQLDWDALSANESVPWTMELIKKYYRRISWGCNIPEYMIDGGELEYLIKSVSGIWNLESFPWNIEFLEQMEFVWNFNQMNYNPSIWQKAIAPHLTDEMVEELLNSFVDCKRRIFHEK